LMLLPSVVVRLDRTTQYSEMSVMESRRRGVLGPRVRGDDGFYGAASHRGPRPRISSAPRRKGGALRGIRGTP
jgi:hypothetical protein